MHCYGMTHAMLCRAGILTYTDDWWWATVQEQGV
jgi:hypothetical protein